MSKVTKLMVILSIIIIIISMCIDLIPNISLNTSIKLIIYILVIIIAFVDMKINLRKANDDNIKDKMRKDGLVLILVIYSILLISLLFIDGNYGRYGIIESRNTQLFSKLHFELYSNFIPFKTISSFIKRFMQGTINANIVITNILGNIIAFSPYGILIPLISKEKFNNLKNFSILMVVIILCVECIQFITFNGSFDIDDLILNLFGAIIMFLFIKIKRIEKLLNIILS